MTYPIPSLSLYLKGPVMQEGVQTREIDMEWHGHHKQLTFAFPDSFIKLVKALWKLLHSSRLWSLFLPHRAPGERRVEDGEDGEDKMYLGLGCVDLTWNRTEASRCFEMLQEASSKLIQVDPFSLDSSFVNQGSAVIGQSPDTAQHQIESLSHD